MKNTLLKLQFLFLLTIFSTSLFSANFKDLPTTITQPDGTTIQCLASGDEFFNYLHDANGYTIIEGQDGWFYYATKDLQENIIPSLYKVGLVSPENTNLQRYVKLTKSQYQQKVDRYFTPLKDNTKNGIPNIGRAPSSGTFNNLVVYIRFADDPAFSNTRQTYIDLFTGTGGATYSVQEYFTSVSYNQMLVNASHFPECAPTTNLSFQDAHDRGYFQPYNASTNPGGYADDTEARLREHQLLVDAVNYTKTEIEASLTANDIDLDADGYVDNMSFIIYGANDTWSDLLWAHRWALYTYTVTIHGKRVWDYTFQPETQCTARTTCHELFHCMGSPDLYHYTDNGVNPCWYWDLMEYGSGSMTAYMKEQIGGWITIPEITSSGSYALSPLAGSTNNAYKIALPNSATEFIVLEYRKKTGPVEVKLTSSADEGLLIYRINTNVSINDGNRNGPPDMLWVYRPNGDTNNNGTPGDATFSSTQGRTSFSDVSNPALLLSDDATWGGISITNVGAVGTTISFDVTMPASTYDVTFNVSDGTNPIENATVTFDGTPQSTDASGATVFTGISDGTYAYSVTKAGYQDDSGNATVNGSNLTKNITLSQSTYNVTFNVNDGTNPIENATVTFDGVPQSTNASGTTVFYGYVNGTYAYSVSKTGYVSDNGNVIVNGNHQQKNITLIEDNYDVTFNVSDGTNPIENAAVTFNSLTQYTDATGATVFLNVPIGNGLAYSVTYAGYNDVNSTVNVVNQNVVENVVMGLDSLSTKLRNDFCGLNTSDKTTIIYCDPIAGAQDYEFVFTNTGLGFTGSKQTSVAFGTTYGFRNYIRISYITGILYGYTYDVKVRAKVNGVWGNYGTICQLTLSVGTTQLNSYFCGLDTSDKSTVIYCDPVTSAEDYEFIFTNTGLGFSGSKQTSVAFGSTYGFRNYIRISYITGILYGYTYDVKVRAKVNGVWGDFGNICQLTLSVGTTRLKDPYCGLSTPSTSTIIYCDQVTSAQDYEFVFTNSGLGFSGSKQTSVAFGPTYGFRNYIRINYISGIIPGNTYDVTVRAKVNGVWGSYGTMCQITVTSGAKSFADVEPEFFNSIPVGAYPNPFNNSFKIQWDNLDQGIANIEIYDITGKKFSTHSVNVTEDKEFGQELIPGIYFVRVKAPNGFVETFKMIKTR